MPLNPGDLAGLRQRLDPAFAAAQVAVMKGLITDGQLQECLDEQRRSGRPIDELLQERGLLRADQIAGLKAEVDAL